MNLVAPTCSGPGRRWSSAWRAGVLAAVAGLAGLAGGCTESAAANYTIEILGPRDTFASATRVTLHMRDKEVASANVSGGMPFALEVGGIDPMAETSAIFTIRAFNAGGELVAFGSTPEVDVQPQNNLMRVFVQPPASIARGPDLEVKLRDHFAIQAETLATGAQMQRVTAPVFGLGRTSSATDNNVLSNALFIYNPITHRPQRLEFSGSARRGIARLETAPLSRGEPYLTLYGGVLPDGQYSPRLERLAILRRGFAQFGTSAFPPGLISGGAQRAGGVLAAIGSKRLIFGGTDQAGTALPSIAVVEDNGNSVTVSDQHPAMAAPREGHTVTVDPSVEDPATKTRTLARVLVYGGAAADAPVAELWDPKTSMPVQLPAPAPAGARGLAHPGTARSGHQAVILPPRMSGGPVQVLILGGRAEDGTVRGDSIIGVPAEARFAESTLVLRTPRADFAAFVLRDDIVVVGGVDAAGQPVATAEIYDAATLALIKEVPAFPRIRPTATPLNNFSAIIIGGEANDAPLGVVEIYQPRRTL